VSHEIPERNETVNTKATTFEPFQIRTLDALQAEASRIRLELPVSSDVALLGNPVLINGVKISNRLCVQPMEGCDADASGAPGELTFRRYRRYAEGGFGLIWLEAAAVDGPGRSNPQQLWMNRKNLTAFTELVHEIKTCARQRWGHDIRVILQLAHAGRYCRPQGEPAPLLAVADSQPGSPSASSVVSDEDLDALQEKFVSAGCLAMDAGFDGVDIKACYNDLPAELLCAVTRPGRYGGSLENRSRFLCGVIAKLSVKHPKMLLASRLSIAPDVTNVEEAVALALLLQTAGVKVLNLSALAEVTPSSGAHVHPLERFVRLAEASRTLQQALPGVAMVAGGFSWFRHFLPHVAAGVVQGGGATLIGVGRAALAYPSLAGDILQKGNMEPDGCCITCDACVQMMKDDGHTGCAIMDGTVYGGEYRTRRHFATDHLKEEAKRCRGCEPAPCRAGCPTRIDVPAFLSAFAEGQIGEAYEILRKANALPEMCAHLCPVGTLCEGRCVAGTLDGIPIPIHDIQYAVSWEARRNNLIGIRIPASDSGKKVAIVGAGPAGLSCAATLLELGHQVVLFERSSRLGGTPEQVIRSSRFTGAHAEAQALLMPALRQARLVIKYGVELGRNMTLEEMLRGHDALFLAAGVWGEKSLGVAKGVVAGLDFLSQAKAGSLKTLPERVILLAGGDSAMDSARVALEQGARELLIVYAGPLSEMHWHMDDSWFRTEGVHFLTMTQPLGYCVDADGHVTGLRIRRYLDGSQEEASMAESMLASTLIIEAMGLGLEASLASALQGCSFTEEALLKTTEGTSLACGLPGLFAGGGVINGGASVSQCVAEGMRAANEIDLFLRTGE
jgi:NADPH-dependent glutamate synthase beta subunit-like oxidoreductase/2,4-dienoyl-CoA reductase-like NADH-dependent reductase (Old Yellow Enzyme family)